MAILVDRAGDLVGDWFYHMDGNTPAAAMNIVTIVFSTTISMLPLDEYGHLNTAALREQAGCGQGNQAVGKTVVEVYSRGIEYEVRVQCKVRRD